jgi:hypothetical protein
MDERCTVFAMSGDREIPLTDLGNQLGQVVGALADGTPTILTSEDGKRAALVPMELLAVLPPGYFDEAQRARDAAELEADMADRFSADETAAALQWAEDLDGSGKHHAA